MPVDATEHRRPSSTGIWVRSPREAAQRCGSALPLINQPPVSISDELLYWSVYHQDLSPTRKAALILGSITLFEGFFVVSVAFPDPRSYFVWLGFLPGRHTPSPLGYPAGLIVAGLFEGCGKGRGGD